MLDEDIVDVVVAGSPSGTSAGSHMMKEGKLCRRAYSSPCASQDINIDTHPNCRTEGISDTQFVVYDALLVTSLRLNSVWCGGRSTTHPTCSPMLLVD